MHYEIIDIAQENVISGDTAEKLNLLWRINKLTDAAIGELTDLEDIPDLANCTGTLLATYSIKVNSSVEGVTHPPRRQPATLKRKIELQLKELESDLMGLSHECKSQQNGLVPWWLLSRMAKSEFALIHGI